jgi:hypothetical protein
VFWLKSGWVALAAEEVEAWRGAAFWQAGKKGKRRSSRRWRAIGRKISGDIENRTSKCLTPASGALERFNAAGERTKFQASPQVPVEGDEGTW